jgi:peptide-methionine (S)-S-oxide reductase
VGYTGGTLDDPTYKDVCTDKTGHAEAVEIEYDPSIVKYGDLLNIFWSIHNPTTMNRQGPDFGTQYRSVIFYHDDSQKNAAIKSKADLEKSGRYQNPIVTEIVPAGKFYDAEEYHQKYLMNRGEKSCGLQ